MFKNNKITKINLDNMNVEDMDKILEIAITL
jgi:hypothetical protein